MADILVIDDEAAVRAVISEMLEDAGHQVVETGDGIHALDLLGERVFDVVICDIIMPEMDGIELISTIKRRKTGTKIIAISGGGRHLNLDVLSIARDLGADRVIDKPFTRDALVDLVAACLAAG